MRRSLSMSKGQVYLGYIMKRIIATIIVSVLIAFGSVQATAQSFNAGVIAGATFGQVDGDYYAGFHQLGFTAGFYVNLPLDDYWSAQMELKYSLLGAHSSDKEVREYGYPPYSLRLHYAEVPLMIRYNLGALRLHFLTLEAGASLDSACVPLRMPMAIFRLPLHAGISSLPPPMRVCIFLSVIILVLGHALCTRWCRSASRVTLDGSITNIITRLSSLP